MSYSPLAPEFTEDKIRAALDGTFTRFDPVTGGVKTATVEPDHAPTHQISGSGGRPSGISTRYKQFTPVEDEMLIGLKAKGLPASHIARLMGRSDDSGINKRYRRLVRSGKCQAVVA